MYDFVFEFIFNSYSDPEFDFTFDCQSHSDSDPNFGSHSDLSLTLTEVWKNPTLNYDNHVICVIKLKTVHFKISAAKSD